MTGDEKNRRENIDDATAVVKFVEALMGAAISALMLGGSIWLYRKIDRQMGEVREAYRAGETIGEIVRDAATLPEDARQQLHRDIRRMERGEADGE